MIFTGTEYQRSAVILGESDDLANKNNMISSLYVTDVSTLDYCKAIGQNRASTHAVVKLNAGKLIPRRCREVLRKPALCMGEHVHSKMARCGKLRQGFCALLQIPKHKGWIEGHGAEGIRRQTLELSLLVTGAPASTDSSKCASELRTVLASMLPIPWGAVNWKQCLHGPSIKANNIKFSY
jgi:hypothetical protein